MSYTAIFNLLICAADYNNVSENEVASNLEFLDENIEELIDFVSLVPDKELQVVQLYNLLNNFFVAGYLVTKKVLDEEKDWIVIREKAIDILDALKIEIIPPDEFLDKYDWEDGEQWDFKR